MGLLTDGLIILAYFAVIIAIGLYMGRREESLRDFALGNRQIPWWAVMASIIAAETSAATFLGAPGEGYDKRSLAYVQLVLGVIIGRFIVGTFFLKPYYAYRVYTVYDYLGIRFGPKTKSFVSFLFLVMRTLASGTRLFVPSLVMVLAWKLFVTGGHAQHFGQSIGVRPYVAAIIILTILTGLYTVAGGIKAVIWTDVIQACLMFGSALIAVFTLLNHIGGLHAVAVAVPQMTRMEGYFQTGFEPARIAAWRSAQHIMVMTPWEYVKLILANDYTLFAALIGSALSNMAAFGADQDMVQRLLTAETHRKAKRSLLTAACMDLPIASAFTFIGILLYVFYLQHPAFKPAANADVFGAYILNVMPVGIRGLVLAGVFATAMGSLSAALNALATSATNDWYVPFLIRRGRSADDARLVSAARFFTALFAILMVVVAGTFAYAKVTDPDVRIIPIVLGIAGFILGPMLGVFLIGMFTRQRGSDRGNLIAITAGLLVTIILGDLHTTVANSLATMLGYHAVFARPLWLPKVSFTWFAAVGAAVVFCIGVLFKTPETALTLARKREQEAVSEDDLPVDLRT
jgi:SSS family transporter